MHLLWKRYSGSGAAPPWFYVLMAAAFIGLAAWAAAQGDWLVMALAVAMMGVTLAGARIMRSMRDARPPRRPDASRKDGDDG
jgi:hypothetical protein